MLLSLLIILFISSGTVPVLLLLLLSAASFQDNMENRPLDGKVCLLDPDLENGVPKIKMNVSVITIRPVLPPSELREKNKLDDDSMPYGELRWVKWEGSLPNGAVSIYNDYGKRTDYVCKVGCHSGFFNPRMGSYCHYPDKKEHLSSSFQILVNEDNFRIFVWKEGSYGSVPKNSVRICSSEEIYVGKNKYGLGKVYPKDGCFYLPWKGSEFWYQWSYEVLTNLKAEEEIISDFKYITDKAKIFKEPLKILNTSTATNNALNPVMKTVSLSRTFRDEGRWDFRFSVTVGLKASVRVGIPTIVDGNVEISGETTIEFSKGNTQIDEVSHSFTLQLTVPPKHSCKVSMVGYQFKIEVPYSARLSRTYENGATRSAIMYGTYHGVQTMDVRAEVEQYKPLSGYQLFSEDRSRMMKN